MDRLRKLRAGELVKVAEYVDRSNYLQKTLGKRWSDKELDLIKFRLETNKISSEQLKMTMEGSLLTYLLHCEARIASFLGRGYYTIGPSGEELLGFVGLNLKKYDLTALHYRHLATSIVRQLQDRKSLEAIALDRARGFTCSIKDPVTTGRHCSIGGNHDTEYLVTSTLASQAPPALGRALGISLSNYLLGSSSNFYSDAISYVSVGDGSINNAHFLSALNLAKYSEHSKFKCPMVFAVSDNQICISLKSTGYLDKFIQQQGIFTRIADGRDFLDVYEKSQEVIEYSRRYKRPSLFLMTDLPRRFGHAATDRQFAYLTAAEIQEQVNRDPLSDTFSQLIQAGIYSANEFEGLLQSSIEMIEKAFDQADSEPKNTSRDLLIASNAAALAHTTRGTTAPRQKVFSLEKQTSSPASKGEVMRKQMTKVFDEILQEKKEVVYIGEDVEHGGYYLVTEGLKKKVSLQSPRLSSR